VTFRTFSVRSDAAEELNSLTH